MISRREFARRMAGVAAGACVLPPALLAQAKPTRPFKLSVMLWTLRPKYTAEQAINLVAAAGYDGFELVDEDRKWSSADLKRIRARMEQLGIVCDAVSGIDAGFAEKGAAQKLADELAARMDQAERLGCRRIILLSGKRDASLPHARQHELCIQNLQRAGDIAAKRHFQLLLEPIDRLENPTIYLTHVEEAFSIARSVNLSSVAVLYDIYHQAQEMGFAVNTAALLQPLQGNMDLLQLVHVANVPGRHAPDTGKIRYPEIYAGLRKNGYHGWMAMEFLPLGDAGSELRQAAEAV